MSRPIHFRLCKGEESSISLPLVVVCCSFQYVILWLHLLLYSFVCSFKDISLPVLGEALPLRPFSLRHYIQIKFLQNNSVILNIPDPYSMRRGGAARLAIARPLYYIHARAHWDSLHTQKRT